jgi:DNA-binding transcriptional ArsR family regulator
MQYRNGGSALAVKGKSKSKKDGTSDGVDQRLVKALAHPLRVQILTILNERIASPNGLAQELEEGLSQVSYHVKVLKDYKCIELVKTVPRRGAVEHYYRATARPFLTDRDWQKLPDSIRPGMSADLLQMLIDDAVAALEEGTFDDRDDRHMSRYPMIVDEKGWKDLIALLEGTLKRVASIQADSAERLSKKDDEGLTVSVAMMAFEAPPDRRKVKLPKKVKAKPKRKS